jgi:multiple sugar transport system permease protein
MSPAAMLHRGSRDDAGREMSRDGMRGRLGGAAVRQGLAGAALSGPAAAFLLVFWVIPLLYAVYLSFTKYDLAGSPEWVGLANFRQMWADPQFWHSARITLLFTVCAVVPSLLLALLIAIPLARPGRITTILRGLIFIPAAIPLVAASLIWTVLYASGGLADLIAQHTPVGVQGWLTDPNLALWSLLVMVIWKYLGLYVILFVAGLQALPGNVYEAAAIDGSRAARTFFLITLPQLRRTFLFVLVVAVAGAFNSFAPAYLLTQGGPGTATQLLPLYIYNNAFTFTQMGYAAALALVLLAVLLILSVVQFRAIRLEAE